MDPRYAFTGVMHPALLVRALPGGNPSVYDRGYAHATGNIRPEGPLLSAGHRLNSRWAGEQV